MCDKYNSFKFSMKVACKRGRPQVGGQFPPGIWVKARTISRQVEVNSLIPVN